MKRNADIGLFTDPSKLNHRGCHGKPDIPLRALLLAGVFFMFNDQ
jgi:hypothetical protein